MSNRNKRRSENNPRIEITADGDDTNMAIDDTSPLPSPLSSSSSITQNYNEISMSRELKRLRLDSTINRSDKACSVSASACTILDGASNVAQNFAIFAPLIGEFFVIAK